ncbi:MAG: lysozyme [Pseudomonadota bacterium]
MPTRRDFLIGGQMVVATSVLSGCGRFRWGDGGSDRRVARGGGRLFEPNDRRLTTDHIMVDHLRRYETLQLNAYSGPSGMTLIGYGHAKYARMGMRITPNQAEELLWYDVRNHEAGVKRLLHRPIRVHEFSAMSALAFNVGVGAFSKSSILKRFNRNDRRGSADAFLLWNKYRKNGVLTVSGHLSRRRADERRHFLGQSIII